jgi:SAM-dependent methyltransferase
VTRVLFTGERLHEGDALFGVDLARHQAAYEFARALAAGARVLDLGCGTGYGTAALAERAGLAVGVDRIAPDASARRGGARFLRADLSGIPLRAGVFDLVVSFQVIEHLREPGPYLGAIARCLRPGGTALLTTPNRLTSDGVNPFHVHEYEAAELAALLNRHFGEVELRGLAAGPAVAGYFEARLRRIRRVVRLDPLRLRERLPRALVEGAFAFFARRVRRGIARGEGLPDASWRDFPIGPADPACLDLLAICRGAREGDATRPALDDREPPVSPPSDP